MAGEPLVTIVGTAAADAELRYTPSGVGVASVSMAVNSRKKVGEQYEDDGTTWYRVTGWRQMAENMAESIRRGDRIWVQGYLRSREYERQDGTTGMSLEIQAQDIGHSMRFAQTMQKRVQRQQGGQGQGYQQGAPQQGGDPWSQPPQQQRQAPPQQPAGDPWGQAPQYPAHAGPGGQPMPGSQGYLDEPPF